MNDDLDFLSMKEWGEDHGYTNRCPGCGQRTDSSYCSPRCAAESRALDELAAKCLDGETEED